METTILGRIEIDYAALDVFIRSHIPSGFSVHEAPRPIPDDLKEGIKRIASKTGSDFDRHLRSFGTLGGGNHFIEINEDEGGIKYLVIHSGSRNFGLQIANYHQKRAIIEKKRKVRLLKKEMTRTLQKLKREKKETELSQTKAAYHEKLKEIKVPDALAYLQGPLADDYIQDTRVAHTFATLSRKDMAKQIVGFLGLEYKSCECFTTVHNYISPEDKIIRKGAISAKAGERVLIPINMADGSLLATGKGNHDWNCSGPHGAGRLLSRHEAKNQLTMTDYTFAMEAVYSTSVKPSTLDEAPMAYKSIEEIVKHTADTIDLVAIIKPKYNFKA